MVTARAYDSDVLARLTYRQKGSIEAVKQMIEDLGQDCEITLDNEESDDPWDYDLLFSGTTLYLSFDKDVISVVDFNLETGEDVELEYFDANELNKATHWLLTQANLPNVIS